MARGSEKRNHQKNLDLRLSQIKFPPNSNVPMPTLSGPKDVQDFISFLRLKNLSQRTIREYKWVLHDFLGFCSTEIQTPREATFDNLRDYIAGLQARRLSPKTIGDRVKILKQFFGYLCIEGRIPSDPAKMLPVSKAGMRLPKALNDFILLESSPG